MSQLCHYLQAEGNDTQTIANKATVTRLDSLDSTTTAIKTDLVTLTQSYGQLLKLHQTTTQDLTTLNQNYQNLLKLQTTQQQTLESLVNKNTTLLNNYTKLLNDHTKSLDSKIQSAIETAVRTTSTSFASMQNNSSTSSHTQTSSGSSHLLDPTKRPRKSLKHGDDDDNNDGYHFKDRQPVPTAKDKKSASANLIPAPQLTTNVSTQSSATYAKSTPASTAKKPLAPLSHTSALKTLPPPTSTSTSTSTTTAKKSTTTLTSTPTTTAIKSLKSPKPHQVEQILLSTSSGSDSSSYSSDSSSSGSEDSDVDDIKPIPVQAVNTKSIPKAALKLSTTSTGPVSPSKTSISKASIPTPTPVSSTPTPISFPTVPSTNNSANSTTMNDVSSSSPSSSSSDDDEDDDDDDIDPFQPDDAWNAFKSFQFITTLDQSSVNKPTTGTSITTALTPLFTSLIPSLPSYTPFIWHAYHNVKEPIAGKTRVKVKFESYLFPLSKTQTDDIFNEIQETLVACQGASSWAIAQKDYLRIDPYYNLLLGPLIAMTHVLDQRLIPAPGMMIKEEVAMFKEYKELLSSFVANIAANESEKARVFGAMISYITGVNTLFISTHKGTGSIIMSGPDISTLLTKSPSDSPPPLSSLPLDKTIILMYKANGAATFLDLGFSTQTIIPGSIRRGREWNLAFQ